MSPHDHDLQAAADEARLTAYALGEVSGDEAAAIAARIADDPDARRTVEEVRAVAALLSEGIGAGEPAGLADAQRAAVLAAAEKAERGRRFLFWPAAAAAAVLVGVVSLATWAGGPRYGLDMASGKDLRYQTEWGPSSNAEFGASAEATPDGDRRASALEAELALARTQLAESEAAAARAAAVARDYAAMTDRLRQQAAASTADTASIGEGSEVPPDSRVPFDPPPPGGPGGGPMSGGGDAGGPVTGGPVLGDAPRVGVILTTRDEPVTVAEAVHVFGQPGDPVDSGITTATYDDTVPRAAGAILTIAGGSAADGDAAGGVVGGVRPLVQRDGVDFSTLFVDVAGQPERAAHVIRYLKVTGNEELQKELRVKLQAQLSEQVVAALDGYMAESQDRESTIREIARRLQYPGGEAYEHPGEARFRSPRQEPLSTFSIDVDTASYSNVRRFLRDGALPPAEAVRLEELINYFDYDYTPPAGEHPVAATIETASCPWNTSNRLVRIGLRARDIVGEAPPANLVFLIDVSGSMQPANKLPLVQQSLRMLVDQMREQDRIAIVTYANGSGVRLASTTGDAKDAIRGVIDGLTAGGSTNGGAGIQDAYRIAAENLFQGGTNRVVLATDGDFNVGVTDRNDLVTLIEEQAKSGVFLSILGVGTGNIKDATLEQLADKGNGNYAYLDSLAEARKVLVDEMMGTLVAVAKDVKVQVEFNPLEVQSYRMIGYENRVLATQDFDDDTKDAGEMGAGHTVTMLYEIVPAPGATAAPLPRKVEELRYQRPPMEATEAARTGEIMTLKFRYKQPDAHESVKLEVPVKDSGAAFDAASADFRFASAVASFGMLLRRSPTARGISWDGVLELAYGSLGEDAKGRRAELLDLVRRAKQLSGR